MLTYADVCISKARTAFIFPNAIEITTRDQKLLFASFLFRREAYKGLCRCVC
jgi:hypothetical protein